MSALQEKQELVNSVVQDLQEASAIYLVNFTGISVELDNALRKNLTTKGIKYRAVKNTLLKRAFDTVGITGMDKYLIQASAIMLGREEDPMLPAKEIVAFQKANPEFMMVKGISLEGEFIAGGRVDEVSKMPGRLDIIAEVVTLALGPGANLVALFKGPGSTLAGQVKALEEKLEKAE
jgi:large subunit ribosomal protein L10